MPRPLLTSVLLCVALHGVEVGAQEAAAPAPAKEALAEPEYPCEREPRCRALSADGVQRSERKDYAGALEAFRAAYAIVPEPRLLINMGRCSYRMGRPAQALTYYHRQEVARIAEGADVRERLQQYIAESELALRTEQQQLARLTPPPPPHPPPPLSRPRWRVGLGATGLALGLALTGGAVAALVLDDTCVRLAPGGCQVQLQADGRLTSSVYDTAILGYSLLAAGGGLVVAGVVLWAVPARRP